MVEMYTCETGESSRADVYLYNIRQFDMCKRSFLWG